MKKVLVILFYLIVMSYHAYAQITINDSTYENGASIASPFCINDEIIFSLQIDKALASYLNYIDYVIWDMGDGVTEKREISDTFTYVYESPQYQNSVSATVIPKQNISLPFPIPSIPPIDVHFNIFLPDTIHIPLIICDKQPIQWEDTITSLGNVHTFTHAQTIYLRGDDCTKIVCIDVTEGSSTYHDIAITAHNSYEWRGQVYDQSGTYKDTISNAVGCDSILTLNLEVLHCLHISDIQTEIAPICQGETLAIEYTKNANANIAKVELILEDTIIVANKIEERFIYFDLSTLLPNDYTGSLCLYDGLCQDNSFTYPIYFSLYYSSNIFKQKWDHIWAVYNEEYNDGYIFTAYQWYRNGKPIIGETKSWYNNIEPFDPDDAYSVLLTRADGQSQFSCSAYANISSRDNTKEQNKEEETKTAILYTWYNCMGVLVAECANNKVPDLSSGIYIVHIYYDNGEEGSTRIIIP